MTTFPAPDASQQVVVDLADGEDAVVLGAAGSGKTTVLVELVARRVLAGAVAPERLLVLAPDRRSADLLRTRIEDRLDRSLPGGLVRTPASFAKALLDRHSMATEGRPVAYLSGADHDRVIKALLAAEIIEERDGYWGGIGRATRQLAAFRTELRSLIARLVERGQGAEQLAALATATGRAEWAAVAGFWPRLGEALEAEFDGFRPVDVAYQLRRAAELVRAGDPVVPPLDLVLVDDAQELEFGALGLLQGLPAATGLIAFGDPDLATGGFRGARREGFVSPRFWVGRSPRRLALGTVHRHGAAIRTAVGDAVSAVGATALGFEQRRAAATGSDGSVDVVTVGDRGGLVAYVARRLRRRAVAGVSWERFAVVVRGGASVAQLARELRIHEVPAVGAGVSELGRDDWAPRGILAIARIAIAAAAADGVPVLDPLDVDELLTGPVGRLDGPALRRIRIALRRAAHETDPADLRRPAQLIAAEIAAPGGFTALRGSEHAGAVRVRDALHRAIAAAADGTIEDVLWAIWDESGLERVWGRQAAGHGAVADEANRHLDAVVALFDAAKRDVERDPDGTPAQFLERWLDSSIDADSIAGLARRDAVLVGTPQALLGREFDTVVIADLQDGRWPQLRVRGSYLGVPDLADLLDGIDPSTVDRRSEVQHDEVRLLAAAIGHAARRVIAVAIEGEEESPSPLLGLIGEPIPAKPADIAPLTLRGIVGRARRALVEHQETGAAPALARLAVAGVPGADPGSWLGLAPVSTEAPLEDDGVAFDVHPSSLESFRDCPLHWALGRLGADAGSTAASLGTIVHDAADALARDELEPDPTAVFERVLQRWSELEFESDWLERKEQARARRIAARLAEYEAQLRAKGGGTLASETRLELELGRARLTGRIDRVVREPGPGGEVAVVIDFKTGRETRHRSGPQLLENPQLAAYQLALEAGRIPTASGAPLDLGGLEHGGARLVVLGLGPDEGLAQRSQPRLTAEEAARWEADISGWAEDMARPTYLAFVDTHCTTRDGGSCTLHIVPAVTE